MIRKGQARRLNGSDGRQQIQFINNLFEVAARPVAPPWTARRFVPTGGAVSSPRRGRHRDPHRSPSSRPVSGRVSAGDRTDAAVQLHCLDPHGAEALTPPLGLCPCQHVTGVQHGRVSG